MTTPNLPRLAVIPIRNSSKSDLIVVLEPEGDCVKIRPGETCTVEPAGHATDQGTPDELELLYEEQRLTIFLSARKSVYVDGRKVR